MNAPVRIAVVVPTRNRRRLAMNAIRSLRDRQGELEIYLSDNSPAEDGLRSFCARKGVTYLRPPGELAMPAHWDWAIRRMMECSDATHFAIQYDRKISARGAWRPLADIAARWPDQLISFPADTVLVEPPPRRLWQAPWTGKTYAVKTRIMAQVLARGALPTLGQTLPVMSNCLMPRAVLQAVLERFGTVCDSSVPDSAFLWRFLALHDSLIFYDRPHGVIYSHELSNGQAYQRQHGSTFADYMRLHGGAGWLDLAPIPGLNLGQNVLYHEYELARRVVGDRLPPLDRAGVLNHLAEGLLWVDGEEIRDEFRKILRAEGWTGPEPAPHAPPTRESLAYQKRVWRRIRWRRHVPPNICGFHFSTDEAAIRANRRHPRLAEPDSDHLAVLNPVELPA